MGYLCLMVSYQRANDCHGTSYRRERSCGSKGSVCPYGVVDGECNPADKRYQKIIFYLVWMKYGSKNVAMSCGRYGSNIDACNVFYAMDSWRTNTGWK